LTSEKIEEVERTTMGSLFTSRSKPAYKTHKPARNHSNERDNFILV